MYKFKTEFHCFPFSSLKNGGKHALNICFKNNLRLCFNKRFLKLQNLLEEKKNCCSQFFFGESAF